MKSEHYIWHTGCIYIYITCTMRHAAPDYFLNRTEEEGSSGGSDGADTDGSTWGGGTGGGGGAGTGRGWSCRAASARRGGSALGLCLEGVEGLVGGGVDGEDHSALTMAAGLAVEPGWGGAVDIVGEGGCWGHALGGLTALG